MIKKIDVFVTPEEPRFSIVIEQIIEKLNDVIDKVNELEAKRSKVDAQTKWEVEERKKEAAFRDEMNKIFMNSECGKLHLLKSIRNGAEVVNINLGQYGMIELSERNIKNLQGYIRNNFNNENGEFKLIDAILSDYIRLAFGGVK